MATADVCQRNLEHKQTHFSFSCQTHVLGNAVIPQGLRSLRKVRARPASPESGGPFLKRQRTAAQSIEPNEADIAELLLGLSNSPTGSPRDSDLSTEDEEFLPISPSSRRAGRSGSSPRRNQKLARQETNDDSEDGSGFAGFNSAEGRIGKKLPGRCKCGKRVSASHPPCKSELMLLCERFCDRFGHLTTTGEPTRIHLNECAIALGVPRRRLYDITIVYEAVEVVKRTGKLAYVWRGMAHLPELVEQLKREEEAGQPVGDRKGNSLLPQPSERQTPHSLWALSRKFIRLLLTTKGPIQLTEAAEHLIGDHMKTPKRQQTQITVERRLYDIGSILATLNLIHRTYIEGKRQPAFSWNWEWNGSRAVCAQIEHSRLPATPISTIPARHLQPLTLPGLSSGFQIPGVSLSSFGAGCAESCKSPCLPVGALDVRLPHTFSQQAPSLAPSHATALVLGDALATFGQLLPLQPTSPLSPELGAADGQPVKLPAPAPPLLNPRPGDEQCGVTAAVF